jgi:hypothetical protein
MKKRIIIIIGVFFFIRPLIAQTWQPTRRLTWSSLNATYPATTLGPNGHIHLVCLDGDFSNQEIYYKKSTNEGVSWSPTKRLTWNAGLSNYPDIAVDSSNHIHVVWHDHTPGNYVIKQKRDEMRAYVFFLKNQDFTRGTK